MLQARPGGQTGMSKRTTKQHGATFARNNARKCLLVLPPAYMKWTTTNNELCANVLASKLASWQPSLRLQACKGVTSLSSYASIMTWCLHRRS
jgi:hypothetical protein